MKVLAYVNSGELCYSQIGTRVRATCTAFLNPFDAVNDISNEGYMVLLNIPDDKISEFTGSVDTTNTKISASDFIVMKRLNLHSAALDNPMWWESPNVLSLLKLDCDSTLISATPKHGGCKLYNLIDNKGNLLSDEWFLSIGPFIEGVARVMTTSRSWSFINREGIILFPMYNYACDFSEGYALVEVIKDNWLKMDRKGKLYDLYE